MSETTFDPMIWAFPLPDRSAQLFRQLWAFGFEPKGRTFDEIDSRHDAPAPAVATAARASAE